MTRSRRFELRIGFAHFGDQVSAPSCGRTLRVHQQLAPVADGAADDAAARSRDLHCPYHAVGDEEGAGAYMVGQDFQRRAFQVTLFGFACGRLNQALEQINLVVGMHPLQHGGNAPQAHAGIDRGLGQRMHHAGFVAVELHEHVVPDFDETVAVFIRAARRPAGDVRPVVIENLGTRAAGAGVAHHPEVVGGIACPLVVTDANDTFGRHADFLGPDVVGFVIFGIDRDGELVGGNLEDDGEQFQAYWIASRLK